MARCQYCGREVALPFRCRYCGGLFCVEHHLPEKHECPGLRRGAEAFRKLVAAMVTLPLLKSPRNSL